MPVSDDVCENATRRDRSIRLAVVTSFLSKAGTALLQLLAIPLAVRVLGREEFGLFTSVTLTLTTITLLEVGVGPALAHGLAKANADGDAKRKRELASSAFFMMAGISLVTGLVLASLLALVPLPAIYGEDFAGKESMMRPALWLGLGLFMLLFMLNLTARMREGLLEVAKTNLWGAAGNVLAALAIGIGVWFVPEVWFLVLAINGSQVVAKIGNTADLWRRHRDLIPRWRLFRRSVARTLFGDGLAFATCCLLTGVVEYNLCGWMVGRVSGPGAVALYGVFVSMSVMQLGFVMMLTTPTWPAVAEALARGDRAWARRASKKLYRYGVGFVVCAAAGLVILGPWVFKIWLGSEFAGTSRAIFASFAFYFSAHVWRHLNHSLMIGTGQVKRLARVQFLETAILIPAAWFALTHGGLGPMLLAMGVSIFAVTGWTLPRMVGRGLSEGSGELDDARCGSVSGA